MKKINPQIETFLGVNNSLNPTSPRYRQGMAYRALNSRISEGGIWSKAAKRVSSDSSGFSVVSLPGKVDDIAVWVVSQSVKYMKTESVTGSKSARLYCARNETEAFQIIIENNTDETVTDITFSIGEWDTSGVAAITAYREHYIETTAKSYTVPVGTPVGLYPDALIPFNDPYTGDPITTGLYQADNQSIPAGENQGYWFDVRPDNDAEAGTYYCYIKVYSGETLINYVKVTLTIWGFALPTQRKTLTYMSGFYDLHQYYGIESMTNELFGRYQDCAYAHGVFPRPQFASDGMSYNSETGVVTFSSTYHTQMSTFVGKYGKGPQLVVMGWIHNGWVLKSDAQILATLNSYNNMIDDLDPVDKYGQYYVYFDEPYTQEKQAVVTHVKDLMNSIEDSHLKMMLTGDKRAYDCIDSNSDYAADLWVCYGQPIIDASSEQSLIDIVNAFLSYPGKEVWTYSASDVFDNNILALRDWAWYGYWFGATGGLKWKATVASTEGIDQWTEPDTYSEALVYNGLGSFIYPGSPEKTGFSGIGGPVAGIRYKMYRKAIEDFELFRLAESIAGSTAVKSIIRQYITGYSTFATPASYDNARRQLADICMG